MFSFFVRRLGGKFMKEPTIGYIAIFDFLNKGTPSIPMSKTMLPKTNALTVKQFYDGLDVSKTWCSKLLHPKCLQIAYNIFNSVFFTFEIANVC